MPNGTPPPTFPVFDFGARFAAQQAGYRRILESQERMFDLQRAVNGTLFKVQQQADAVLADPEISEENKAEIRGLLVDAEELRANAGALVDKAGQMRLVMLRDAVEEIGRTLQKLKAYRSEVTLGETGLETGGFDRILADIETRYRDLYRPMFPFTKLPGTIAVATVPNIQGWTEQDWDKVHNQMDGPIFLWSNQECKANWNVPGVPACEGPDLFHALSMINQIFVAKQNQIDIMQEFPIISGLDMLFLGGRAEEYDYVVAEAQEALDAVLAVVKDLGRTVAALLKGIRKAAEAFAKAPILLIAGGILAIMVLRKK